jgi:hypothetical protein
VPGDAGCTDRAAQGDRPRQAGDHAREGLAAAFIVPESDERQHELRQHLSSLEKERGFTVLVSHE